MKFVQTALALLLLQGCSVLQEYKKVNSAKELTINKKWVRSTLDELYLGHRPHHRMSPIVTKDFVIQGNAIDSVVAYDRKTATKIWKLKIKNGVEGGGAIYKDNLYFGASDSYFYSVNYFTGKINWSFPIQSEGLGRPFIRDGVVYFVAGNNVAYALDAKTGRQLWLHNRKVSSQLSVRGGSQPNVVGETVLMAFSDGFLVAFNRTTGQVQWERHLNKNRRFNDIDSQPVVKEDRIYVTGFDSALYCLKVSDGSTIWRYDEGGYSRPYVGKENIYYASTNGKVLALDKGSGKLVWEYKNKKGLATTPVLYKGLLIFGQSEGPLVVLSASQGKFLTEFNPVRGVSSEPVVADFEDRLGNVYFITREANLVALDINWMRVAEKWHWQN